MSPPHPALLQLAAGADVGPVADEDAFLRSIHEHRMIASVLQARERGLVALSPEATTALVVEDLSERKLHLRMWVALGRIQDELRRLGAEVAVLKGIATEARWYEAIGQRTCTDLDLLLAPGSSKQAAAVVAALDPDRGCSAAIDWLVPRRLLQHVDLRFDDLAVDLHFDPLKIGLPTKQMEAVWASTEVLDTPQGSIRVLSPEVELVLLLLHLNKDGFALLGPFLDIQRLLQRASLDWDRTREFVRNEGLDIPVWKSLGVVADVLDLKGLPTPRMSGPTAWTWDRLWGGRSILGGKAYDGGLSVQPLLALHASGRRVDKLQELRRRMVPQRPLLEVAGRLNPGESYLRRFSLPPLAERTDPSPK